MAWGGAVLYATSSLPFEAPLWAIGVVYTLSTVLYLLALEMFLAHERTGHRGRAVLFVVCLLLALLTHEQAIGLGVLGGIWLVLSRERGHPPRGRSWLIGVVLPVLIAPAFVALKLALARGEPQVPGLSLGRHLTSPFAVNLIRTLVPDLPIDWAAALVRPEIPEWARPVWRVALLASGVAAFVAAGPRVRFLMAWAALQVAALVAGIGSMTSRHFALALVPGSLLAALAFSRVSGPQGRRVSAIVFGALIAVCALVGTVSLVREDPDLAGGGRALGADPRRGWCPAGAPARRPSLRGRPARRTAAAGRGRACLRVPAGLRERGREAPSRPVPDRRRSELGAGRRR